MSTMYAHHQPYAGPSTASHATAAHQQPYTGSPATAHQQPYAAHSTTPQHGLTSAHTYQDYDEAEPEDEDEQVYGHYPPGLEHEDPSQHSAQYYGQYPSSGAANQHMPGHFDDGEDDGLDWGEDPEEQGEDPTGAQYNTHNAHGATMPGGWGDEEDEEGVMPEEEEQEPEEHDPPEPEQTADDPTFPDISHHTNPANTQPPKRQTIAPYQAGNSAPYQATAGGPADKFRNGKAMQTFKPLSSGITNLATQFYHISGKPKATLAFQKAEPEMKTIQSLRLQLEKQCIAADKAFQTSMGRQRGSSSRYSSARDDEPVQDVSEIMKTIGSFKQPFINLNKYMRQVISEMGYVDRYLLFQRENPVAAKLMEQVVFTGAKLFIPLPHLPF
ncbi:hypothetical protein PV04_01071 [Phialophora macrospora]|uniref:Uncharacterized protein n=1 Tax=Phialophora macrospora TaxID=1851006 RepID=A0A0D2D5P4_9EURO|nr:hypothetical protein PV04_01071 [Phialophora macrospora]